MDLQQLVIKTKKTLLTRKEILSAGVSLWGLQSWLNEGLIERVSRGVYRVATEIPEDRIFDQQFRNATKVVGSKSAICLLSALEYYHLTDHITDKVWMMVPQDKKSRSRLVYLLRTRAPKWTVGIIRKEGFRITSVERTLVDSLIYPKRIDRPTAIKAVQTALKKKMTTLSKLGQMARDLGVRDRLNPIFETFL